MSKYAKRRAELEAENPVFGEDESEDEYVPIKKRKEEKMSKIRATLLQEEQDLAQIRRREEEIEMEKEKKKTEALRAKRTLETSLLAQSQKLREEEAKKSNLREEEKMAELVAQEQRLLEQVATNMHSGGLVSRKEHAKGITYGKRMPPIGNWDMIPRYKNMSKEEADKMRETFFIECNGEDVPPPHKHFRDMRFPQPILDALKEKGILRPTQIQMQGIPALLQGRDIIGIAFTGSGKTLVFVLPMVMKALECQERLGVSRGEGPFGVTMAPSRELANQTYEITKGFCDHLAKDGKHPQLKTVLLMGGTSVQTQANEVRSGCHMVVATPGRIADMLNKKRFTLKQCQYLAFDEADRMIDLGFEDEIRSVLDSFQGQRQTLLFSATMPMKIQDFAKTALFDPVVVNVGRAGAANLDVVQEVEYVKQEAKLPYILQCLQKTAPPALVFCANKGDVDDVHEYLLLKGVECGAIHGGLAQEERLATIKAYKEGRIDVLIGTDVASKGLDFPAIQHVINYDMPKEIEDYIHRIGRTGRRGRTGVATTFVNKNQDETILLDLRAVLSEAKQKIPPFLAAIESPFGHTVKEIGGIKGCAFCGGLGHRIAQCPKLEGQQQRSAGAGRDYMVSGSRYGGDAGYGGDW